jgi:DNA helicase HerA-like ATPase
MMQIRKYGISIIFISQRTAVVSKSALSQCENLIAFKSVDQTGLDYLEGILGYGSKELLPTLSRGEALVYGPAIDIEKSLVINTIK